MLKNRILYFLIVSFFAVNISMAKEISIAGEAKYLDSLALPADAKFEVLLEDITLMDAPSVVLAKQIKSPAGQIPIVFTLDVDDEKIQLGQRYAVRAKVTQNNKLLYITDTLNQVFVGNDDQHLNLVMKRIYKIPKSRVMEGMYKSMPDASLFKDCVTGKYYPVAFEAEAPVLEKAYFNKVQDANFFVKIELEGKIVKRFETKNSEGVDTLIVERFIKILGLKDCTVEHSNVPIINNYWKLTQLYGKKVKTEANDREAHILLQKGFNGVGELKVVTGCNTIIGNYTIEENLIQFRANTFETKHENCKNKALEKDFVSVLDSVSYWKIKGEALQLFDEMDNVLAEFEARYF